jgi:uncharacterized membrane protein
MSSVTQTPTTSATPPPTSSSSVPLTIPEKGKPPIGGIVGGVLGGVVLIAIMVTLLVFRKRRSGGGKSTPGRVDTYPPDVEARPVVKGAGSPSSTQQIDTALVSRIRAEVLDALRAQQAPGSDTSLAAMQREQAHVVGDHAPAVSGADLLLRTEDGLYLTTARRVEEPPPEYSTG